MGIYGNVGNKNSGRKTKAEELKDAVVLKKLQIELARVQNAMGDKELSREEYKVLVDALDKINKNIQLLSGGETERVGVKGINYIKPNVYNAKTDN